MKDLFKIIVASICAMCMLCIVGCKNPDSIASNGGGGGGSDGTVGATVSKVEYGTWNKETGDFTVDANGNHSRVTIAIDRPISCMHYEQYACFQMSTGWELLPQTVHNVSLSSTYYYELSYSLGTKLDGTTVYYYSNNRLQTVESKYMAIKLFGSVNLFW